MENFYTLLTDIGKAKVANAAALQKKLELSKIVLGDSNGSYYEPVESQTRLKHKVWEGQITDKFIDADNPNWIVVQTIIPSQIGGFTIREAGIVDIEGDLVVIAKYPETYKPQIEHGSTKDITINLVLEVSNVENVTLKVDPTIIFATKKNVDDLNSNLNTFKQEVNTQWADKATKEDLNTKTNKEDFENFKQNTESKLSNITNIKNGNAKGSVRTINTKSDYTMGENAFAEGRNTIAKGFYSHAQNDNTIANLSQTAIGKYNMEQGTPTGFNWKDYAFIVGNGTSASDRQNAFAVRWNGETLADGAYSSSGADYAEMFEWQDDNINNEDRVGYFVTLDGEEIRKATSRDNYILGIVSANPAILGDNQSLKWKDKYLTDEWGRIQYEKITVPKEVDEKGNVIIEEHIEEKPILNPNFDMSKNEEYEGRQDRPEWSAVGMLGKLLVRDDGTCEVNSYCKQNDEGIATKADTGYRVMKRVSENIVMVLFK